MGQDFHIRWCGDPLRAGELADFFAANVTPDYISHGELQGARALSPHEWCSDLPAVLRGEIEPRLIETRQGAPGPTSRPILIVEENGAVVALSFVTFAGSAPVPYAIVEDLVVDSARRNAGIGKAILDWIAAEAVTRNIRRVFLESGLRNNESHRFFEREGFQVCSVAMMRTL